MRVLAIGDVHGCFKALTTLEAIVPFGADDLLVTLGDYVDRGSDCRAVLEWLIAREIRGKLVPLRGNHEVMMGLARETPEQLESWLGFGGQATLRSYDTADRGATLADVPESHWRFMQQTCRPYFETETHFFVHACADPKIPLEEQSDEMRFWEKFNNPPQHESGKVMVCGHTAQKSGVPLNLGHAVCIDTWVYGNGWLTCLDIATQEYWQANERGETRSGFLNGINAP